MERDAKAALWNVKRQQSSSVNTWEFRPAAGTPLLQPEDGTAPTSRKAQSNHADPVHRIRSPVSKCRLHLLEEQGGVMVDQREMKPHSRTWSGAEKWQVYLVT
ncbi:hypothetical protein [Streptomyces sp. NPDC101150]|uniref:hypothetical protein n=1 Tax=Streptomyces sp. NPDC101150 TaxID=3366114 RepID=UPI0038071B5B